MNDYLAGIMTGIAFTSVLMLVLDWYTDKLIERRRRK